MSEAASFNMVLEAVSVAMRVHGAQLRKDGVTPYAAHPIRVMNVLALVFGQRDPELLAAAALHDTIEDATVDFDEIAEQFGQRVAHAVALLSKDMRLPEPERERSYYQALSEAPAGVQLCKLADVYDNLMDSRGISPARRAKTLDTAQKVLQLFEQPLAEEWSHALAAVREQAALVASMLDNQDRLA